MDSSEQVTQAVEALVRLLLLQDGQANGDGMDLDGDLDADPDTVDANHEARIKVAQEYCLRILGSRMAPSLVADDVHISDLIKKKRE
ncbi:hypothetical protein BGZ80_004011 [Entomortierella chlamydospora]|uniref:Uncharacterized protein n=1 Tax=Entomortierella chlamydospora TaxID=101097 RepID=A0A9P6T4J1_9FUNG|nr:hypothetical protein BGZ79_006576 [Entomortierella chlamydospora]KAG0024345.1 hypothetical protein BGZ80_004011 [Entomortierella chlamydospora]